MNLPSMKLTYAVTFLLLVDLVHMQYLKPCEGKQLNIFNETCQKIDRKYHLNFVIFYDSGNQNHTSQINVDFYKNISQQVSQKFLYGTLPVAITIVDSKKSPQLFEEYEINLQSKQIYQDSPPIYIIHQYSYYPYNGPRDNTTALVEYLINLRKNEPIEFKQLTEITDYLQYKNFEGDTLALFMRYHNRSIQYKFASLPIRERDPRITFAVLSSDNDADLDLGIKLFDFTISENLHGPNDSPDCIFFRNITNLPFKAVNLPKDIKEPQLHQTMIAHANPHVSELNKQTERYLQKERKVNVIIMVCTSKQMAEEFFLEYELLAINQNGKFLFMWYDPLLQSKQIYNDLLGVHFTGIPQLIVVEYNEEFDKRANQFIIYKSTIDFQDLSADDMTLYLKTYAKDFQAEIIDYKDLLKTASQKSQIDKSAKDQDLKKTLINYFNQHTTQQHMTKFYVENQVEFTRRCLTCQVMHIIWYFLMAFVIRSIAKEYPKFSKSKSINIQQSEEEVYESQNNYNGKEKEE
eukprot:403363781